MSTTDHLEKLSIAEKAATKLVSEARLERARRLKEAKSEAASKLKDFSNDKNKEFKEIETNFLGGSEKSIKDDIMAETDKKIGSMNSEFETNKAAGIALLVDIVQKVEYAIPKSLKDILADA